MRDAALSPLRRSVRDHARGQSVWDASGERELNLHKPGSRYLSDASVYDASSEARDEMIATMSDAWRTPDAFSWV
jgi:hypothetical protein